MEGSFMKWRNWISYWRWQYYWFAEKNPRRFEKLNLFWKCEGRKHCNNGLTKISNEKVLSDDDTVWHTVLCLRGKKSNKKFSESHKENLVTNPKVCYIDALVRTVGVN